MGLTLRAAAHEILQIEGLPEPGNTPALLQAAFSGGTSVAIFDNLLESALMRPFLSGEDTTRGWVNEREVLDFKTQRRTRIQHAEKLARLPRGGTADDLTFADTTPETYKVLRFARQFVVDEQDLVSDDLDALIQPGLTLGRAALRLKLDLIYSVLLANAALADSVALFHSTHNNLNTSATLAAATLDTAIAGCKFQTENGADLGLVTRHIILPPELEGLGRRLSRNMETRSGPSIQIHGEPRLTNGATDPTDDTVQAGSASIWYTSIAAASGPTIELGYIDSSRPRASSWEIDRGSWGRGYSVKWDVGAKALDHRGMTKNTA